MNLNKLQMQDVLNKRVAVIRFTKKDGSERTIHATLKDIPAYVAETPRKLVPEKPENIRVWDVDSESYKTVIVANVLSFL